MQAARHEHLAVLWARVETRRVRRQPSLSGRTDRWLTMLVASILMSPSWTLRIRKTVVDIPEVSRLLRGLFATYFLAVAIAGSVALDMQHPKPASCRGYTGIPRLQLSASTRRRS